MSAIWAIARGFNILARHVTRCSQRDRRRQLRSARSVSSVDPALSEISICAIAFYASLAHVSRYLIRDAEHFLRADG